MSPQDLPLSWVIPVRYIGNLDLCFYSRTREQQTMVLTHFSATAPMNQIQWYAIPYGTSLPVTVTGKEDQWNTIGDSLEIVLYSACEDQRANDLGILPDTAEFLYSTVYVSAHFIRPCSEVVNQWTGTKLCDLPRYHIQWKMMMSKGYRFGYSEDPKFEYMILQYRWWYLECLPGSFLKNNPKWEHRGTW